MRAYKHLRLSFGGTRDVSACLRRSGIFITLLFAASHIMAQDSVWVSGNIQNRLSDSILLSYNNNRIAYYPNEYVAHLNKNGHFSIAFPIPHGVYTEAGISHGNKHAELILQPGDSLELQTDAAHWDSSLTYKGKGSTIQNFMAHHRRQLDVMNWYAVQLKEAINKEPQDFLNTIKQHKQRELDFLEKNKQGLPAAFIKFWTTWHEYYNYFIIEQYPRIHEVVKLRRLTDTVPEINNSVLSELPYKFDDKMMQVSPYLLYLTGIFEAKLRAGGFGYYRSDTANERRLQDSVYKLVYKQMPDKSAEYFLAQDIYGRARTQDLERTRTQFAVFRKRWPASDYLPVVASQVATTERLAAGQPAPDFNIATPEGKVMKLSALKGKVVYISFWATWCKQCVSEMVMWQKTRSLMKKQPVEFVYVSLDADTARANVIFNKYQIDGISTHAAGSWNSTEAQLYGVQGLPAYFLIDKEGNIAVQNAVTPQFPTELVLQIGKLLK